MISGHEPRKATVPRTALETFFSNLSQALHAAAQPLSILRAGLGNPYIEEMTLEDLREIAVGSAIEVERLCMLFNYLQHFVSTESKKPELIRMPILKLVADAVEGVDLLFNAGGVSLRSTIPATCPLVLINRARTQEALSSVLLSAFKISCRTDTVELIVSADPAAASQILVQNVDAHVTALSIEVSLALGLAESLFRSQLGTMCWSLQPFIVRIELLKSSPTV